jgi:uncharacterized protein (TIGR02246 family)
MQVSRCVLLCVLICISSCIAVAQDSTDLKAIKGIFTEFSASWNQPGMPGFDDLFTEDADFVVITGKRLKGRSEIASYHRDLLGKNYNASHLNMHAETVRFVKPDIAIAHVVGAVTYMADGKEQERTGLATATVVRVKEKWRITAFQNTLTSGPGYSWGPPPTTSQQTMPPMETGRHNVGCADSPTPGKRPPDADCAVLLKKQVPSLPPGPLVWRFENFPTTEAAHGAETPASVVVEAAGKVWLLTLASKGGHSKGGTLIAETEKLPPIPTGAGYEIVAYEADLGPDAKVMTHKHSGPETWYLLSGEQCLELPGRALRARKGGTMSAPAEIPMNLNIVGPGKRDALFLIVHDSSKPFNTFLEWQSEGLCQK